MHDKNEFLEKIRKSKTDEGKEHALSTGVVWGNYCSTIAGALLYAFCFFTEQNFVMTALLILFCAKTFGDSLAKYRFYKRKKYLFGAIFFGVICSSLLTYQFVRDIGVLQGWWV